ncbi:FecR domain-containing protein [Sphingomonas sp. HITSZ_GF]|uniref:FecR family protein n=1 Tax=Sphingomonas sp. HITSZ_GF TaxID=3037247 RepID=UPI00240D5863|nr:FecR domain-containing protein [Sphingomonas sp. HITSZ_GF]MDG2533031.1 FecR domain-containing protein [Sphingomonas sp. HITSZ_GF]
MNGEQIEEAAARWVLRREEPEWSDRDEAQLSEWLAQSFAHKAAYWRLEHGWRRADSMAGAEHDSAVAAPRSRFRRWAIGSGITALAASVALAVAIGWHNLLATDVVRPTQQIATGVGGRTHVALNDGSRIELNTDTALRAAVTESHREVWLDHGEAYFEVRHSDTMPFIVHAGSRTVTVLGTKFSVRREGDKVRVEVVTGRVRVDEIAQGGPTGASTTVTTGDIAHAEGRSTLVTSGAAERIEDTLAWRDGRITFSDTELAQAAAEFNRYNAKKLVVVDPAAARIRVGGTFQATNVDAFVRLLHDAYGLKIEDGEREVRIVN